MVQFPFSIPPLSQQSVTNYITYGPHDLETRKLGELFSFGLQANPRQIKRVLRTFYLSRQIAKRQTERNGDEFKLPVLAIFTIIQYRWPDILLFSSIHPTFLGALQKYLKSDQLDSAIEFPPEFGNMLERFSKVEGIKRLLTSEKSPQLSEIDVSKYVFITQLSGPPGQWVTEAKASQQLIDLMNSCERSLLFYSSTNANIAHECTEALIMAKQRGVLVRAIFLEWDEFVKPMENCQHAGIRTRTIQNNLRRPVMVVIDEKVVVKTIPSKDSSELRLEIQRHPSSIDDANQEFETIWEKAF